MTFMYTIPQFAISLKNYLSPYITCQRNKFGQPIYPIHAHIINQFA